MKAKSDAAAPAGREVVASAARELVITRDFDAPRTLVFRAWTEVERAAVWWGPRGFTTLSCEMDVRPGGTWRRRMRSPEGTVHIKRGVYREIEEPERLVFTYADEDDEGRIGHETVVTLRFAEQGGKTKLTLHQAVFDTMATRNTHEGGWTGCMERFAEYLATTPPGNKETA